MDQQEDRDAWRGVGQVLLVITLSGLACLLLVAVLP